MLFALTPALKWAARRFCASAAAILSLSCLAAPAYHWTHYAGSDGGAGYRDGDRSRALFYSPQAIVADGHGGFVVAEASGVLRKIDSAGQVRTLAGQAYDLRRVDGAGTSARFELLMRGAMVMASDGTLYVGDGPTIRVVTTDGNVTTLSVVDKTSSNPVTLPSVYGITRDPAGNLYIAGNDGTIRVIDSAAKTAVLVGPTGVAATTNFDFSGLANVVIDSAGNLYANTQYDQRIWKITSAGVVSLYAGGGTPIGADGTGAAAEFLYPVTLTIDAADNIYVGDSWAVRKIASGAVVTTLAGEGHANYVDAVGRSAFFYGISGLVAASDGNIYVCDTNWIRQVSPSGVVSTWAGQHPVHAVVDGSVSTARFSAPDGITVDANRSLYVADDGCVRKITAAGVVTTLAGSGGQYGAVDATGSAARFGWPLGPAVDANGNVFVADATNHTIRKITPNGVVTTIAGLAGQAGSADGLGAAARFNQPRGVAVDSNGNVFVIDVLNRTVRKIAPDGTVSTFAGTANAVALYGDGVGAAARFNQLSGIAIDAAGTLYVTDSALIRAIAQDGTVTTPVDFAAAGWSVGGYGISVDANGTLYVGVSAGVCRIDPARTLTLIGGSTRWTGCVDGLGTAASFGLGPQPAIASDGTLYIADADNAAIRRGVLQTNQPTITWAQPASITSGTALSQTQLNATASVPGTFSYSPALGTVLPLGTQTLSVTFTPTDTQTYSPVTQTVTIVVNGVAKSYLVNIATRAYCANGDNVTIGGFVVSGTGKKQVLIRAVGPSLTAQGLSAADVLADPMIEVHQGATIVAKNDNWGDNLNAAQITSTAKTIGATALAGDDTKSAALLLSVDPGVYTFIVSGKGGGSGVVLLEVYDADTSNTAANFVNIATRADATTGNGVAIGGFVITGTAPKQVLIRAVGPTLAKQGLSASEVLADPQIELHHGSEVIATNDDWGANANAAAITSTGARIGASPLDSSDSKSAALLKTLDPGTYTFIASGKNNTSGIVVVEVYDAD